MANDETCRPIPAPRRLCTELPNKTQYENVAVHLIDKNLNINVENLQRHGNRKEKIPNNKVLLTYAPIERLSMEDMANNKVILTETNDLYGPNANELVSDEPNIVTNAQGSTTPIPTPRSRKMQNSDKYENVVIMPLTNTENADNTKKPILLRPAPKVPSKNTTPSNNNNNNNNSMIMDVGKEAELQRIRRHSITSETSTTSTISGTTINNTPFEWKDVAPQSLLSPIPNTNLQSSNTSLTESSTDSTDNVKYKSPSPSDLLKSLGNTSKLLTESIGERVAFKTKGAKQKLDKNLKNSSDILCNISCETTQRLKKLSSNFTLTKRDKSKDMTRSSEFDMERPQTVPPNSHVFNTIAFSSPLQQKVPGTDDLRNENDLNSSYEIPRSLRLKDKETSTKSVLLDKSNSTNKEDNKLNITLDEGKERVQANSSNEEKFGEKLKRFSGEFTMDNSDNTSTDSLDLPSPPMPTTPAPILAQSCGLKYNAIVSNSVQPPTRQKRRKNYEEIQLRQDADVSEKTVFPIRDGMNLNSLELQRLNAEAEAQEREDSLILRERIAAEEKWTPIPERSDSWEYHEETESKSEQESSTSSDSEPIYANQETTYGNVFDMATSNKDLLTPQNLLVSIMEESSDDDANNGAVGGQEFHLPNTNIIKEFDPLLDKKGPIICPSDKSNQLLLLEYLLEQETYGTVRKGSKHSTLNSDDSGKSEKDCTLDDTKIESAPFKREDKDNTALRPIQIIHQNANLRSDSTENILASVENNSIPKRNESQECCNGKKVIDDDGKASQSRSQFFLSENDRKSLITNDQKSLSLQSLPIDNSEGPPSYQEAVGEKCQSTETKSRTFSLKSTKNVLSNVKSRVDALKRKTSFKLSSQKTSDVKVTLQMVPRPSLSPLLIRYEGPLVRFPSGMVEDILKEMQNRKAVLRERQFQTFLDHEMKTLKEAIPLEHITTIQCISNSRITDNATLFYCFEITTSTPKSSNVTQSGIQFMSNPNLIMTSGSSGNIKQQRACHVYGVSKESERGIWMQKLLESLTNTVPTKYLCQYYRAGWCYLKYSITSGWSGTWLILKKSQRRLIFVTEATGNIEKVDLRKARCIILKESDDTIKNLHVESGPILMIDAPPFTIYLIMSSSRETKIWRHIIREVAHNNGFTLADQQLTKFNVPVIVDKCINFIYIHGSMSEGIYRKSGSENSIHNLMAAFRADAFSVEITRNDYNEHDVANALKRFMRDLPERLMGKLSDSFICIAQLHSNTEKIHLYRELLARLNVVEYETLKRIINHLAFISSQRLKNKMNIQNLTMIWGPTLVQGHQQDEMIYSQKEADVITDLINNYKELFPISSDDMKKEQAMLNCLEKYYAAAETLTDSVKKSGDLKIWITLNPNPDNTKEEKTQINVTVSPTKTAYDICKELAPKMHLSVHQLTLHESILNGNLERPLHHDTKIFDVILNWSFWPDNDRKNNMLMVKPIELLNDIQRAIKNSATITPGKELKFADKNSKTFKTLQCDLRDGKIVITKKEKNVKSTIVKEIFLHSSTVYLGCEKKREFPWSWAITFVEIPKTQILRSRESPFIGHVLAGCEWVDRTIWYSSIWYSLYGDNILPPAEIILK